MRTVQGPWSLDPSDIRQPVHVFQGRQDTVVPPAHAEHWIEILDVGSIVETLSA